MKTEKVESLYFGDKRLDVLFDFLYDEICARAGGQDIPTVSIIGLLERLKYVLLEDMT